MSHTKGPWTYKVGKSGIAHIVSNGCNIYKSNGYGEIENTARLIAAAPELLEALEYCIIRLHKQLTTTEATKQIEALIAKAKG